MLYNSSRLDINKAAFFDFIFFCSLLLFIIPIQIYFFGVVFKTTLISVSLIMLFSLALSFKEIVVCKLNIYPYYYLFFLFFIAFLQFSGGGFLDFSLVKDVVIAILISLTSWFFVTIAFNKKGENSTVFLLNVVTFIGSLNSIVMIIVFLSDGFAEFLYSFIAIDPKYHVNMQHGMRNPGLYYTGFSILSVVYSIFFIIKLVIVSEVQEKINFIDVVVLLLLVVGIFYSGRAGFLILILGIIMYVVSAFFRENKKPLNQIFKIFFGLLILASIFLLVLEYFGYGYYFKWFFEIFINLSESGMVESSSTNHLLDSHYFLPDNEVSLLFGIGNFGRVESVPYIYSDVGYVLFMHGVGIVGMIFFFFFFLYMLYIVFHLSAPFYLKFIFFYIVFSIVVASFKDFYFLSHLTYGQLFFLVYYLAVSEHRRIIFNKRLASE